MNQNLQVSLMDAISLIQPLATFENNPNCVLADQGQGPIIAFWNDKVLGPQPSILQLQAVTPVQVAQSKIAGIVNQAKNSLLSNSDSTSMIVNAIIASVPGLTQSQVIANLGNTK